MLKWTGLMAGVLALALSTGASAQNVITNGGFEAGTFSGWTSTRSSGGAGSGCNTEWVVQSTGPGGGCWNSLPAGHTGSYRAYTALDGAGPVTFSLFQSFVVPSNVGSASLSFAYAYFYDLLNFGATQDRTFSVSFEDALGSTLFTAFSETYAAGTTGSAPWTTRTIDVTSGLAAYAGRTVQLSFEAWVPEHQSGPADLGLDDVSLTVDAGASTVPEPMSLLLVGSGLAGVFGAARRRRREGEADA